MNPVDEIDLIVTQLISLPVLFLMRRSNFFAPTGRKGVKKRPDKIIVTYTLFLILLKLL